MTRVVEGRTHRLSLEPDVLGEAADWMDRQRALWGRLFDVVDEYLKEDKQTMKTPPIVSPEEWRAAREKLLVKEKEHTRAGDALAAERRRMPWMAVEKEYAFEGPNGPASLLDLFDGRSQLVVYRAFYGPEVTTYANPEGRRVPGAGLRRLLLRRRPGRAPGPPERAGHDARVRLARSPGRDPGPEGAHGLGQIPWYTITDDFDADFGVASGTVTTLRSRRRRGSSAPTSSTPAVTRRWGAPGAIST